MTEHAEVEARARALEQIVVLANEHGLTASDIGAALGAAAGPGEDGDHRKRAVLVQALAYLGGTFVFAGVGVFIALQWDAMSSAARVVITLGSGIAALVLALISAREPRFDKAATPLFLMAAALEPTGLLVAFDEFGSGGDWRWAGLITSGVIAVQFVAVFSSVRRSTPLFLLVLFAALFWWTAFDLLDADDTVVALVVGSSLVLTAIGVDRTLYRAVTPVWYLFGSAAFLYGLFDIVEGTPLEIVFLMAASAFVYLSAVVHSRTLLFVATAATLAYTGWFTSEHFANSVGWPIALVVFGMLMIGLSSLAFRIDRRYVRQR
jgi:hypothetical protein